MSPSRTSGSRAHATARDSSVRKKGVLPLATPWMDPEGRTMLSEVSQAENHKNRGVSLLDSEITKLLETETSKGSGRCRSERGRPATRRDVQPGDCGKRHGAGYLEVATSGHRPRYRCRKAVITGREGGANQAHGGISVQCLCLSHCPPETRMLHVDCISIKLEKNK